MPLSWALPQMTSHLLLLIVSCSLPVLPGLSLLVFSTPPKDAVAELEASLTLDCAVYNPRQQRAVSVRWMRARGEASVGPVDADIRHLANGSLLFPRLTDAHLGKYVCSASAGDDHISAVAQVEKAGLGAVFFHPQAQTASAGDGVYLQCVSGDSSPPAHITWLKDGAPVTTGVQVQGQYGGGYEKKTSGTLHLPNVTLEDDGRYVCLTYNPLLNVSKESRAAPLIVLGVPRQLQITQGPDNITAAVATEASMLCAVSGSPVPMVHWFKDGHLLTNCSGSFSLRDNGQLLVFRNVTEQDEGFYHCEAANQNETRTSQPAYLLPAVMGWSFIQHPTDQTVKRGQEATLVCRPPHSKPPAQVSWFKDNRLLTPKAHFTVMSTGDLFFSSVQASDSGTYFCRASNAFLHQVVSSRRMVLTVLTPPSVKLWPQSLTVPVDAQVVLHCQVWGQPPPTINWFKQGRVQTGGKIAVGVRNATLYISSVKSYDEARYTCAASNALGRDYRTATLRVAASPVMVSFAGQVVARLGASASLPCRAVGVLPITYSWTKGRANASIQSTEQMHIDDSGTLHISSVKQSDGGAYHCTAENRAGRQQRATTLSVVDPTSHKDRPTQGYVPLPTSAKESMLGLKVPPVSPEYVSKPPVNQQTTSTTQSILTQMQPPFSYVSIQPIGQLSQTPLATSPSLVSPTQPSPSPSQPSLIGEELFVTPTQFLFTPSQPQTKKPSGTRLYHQVIEPLLLPTTDADLHYNHAMSEPLTPSSLSPIVVSVIQPTVSYLLPPLSLERPTVSPVQTEETHSQTVLAEADMHHSESVTLSSSSPSSVSPRIPQVEPAFKQTESQPSPTVSQSHQTTPQQPFTHTSSHQPQPQPSLTWHLLPSKDHLQPSVTQVPSSTSHQTPFTPSPHPQTQPHSPSTQYHPPDTQPQVVKAEPRPTKTQLRNNLLPQLFFSTTPSSDQSSSSTTSDPTIFDTHQFTMTEQTHQNASQQANSVQPAKSANDTEPTEWLSWNTSQSPMTSDDPRVIQQSPPWLPVLEKHDIPIVVGVGVSLAFIFITMGFYSLVQKNEPVPTNRAAQRNLGVPSRHAERRTMGRTYENRAYEDDELMAVVEQSPNTSDTHARPPGPSLVTVEMEAVSEELQQTPPTNLEEHAITVETHPEPLLDAQIDPFLEEDEEDRGCSLSQPSIQLQCVEDWASAAGDNHIPPQDTLPPPSPLLSCSPSPSLSPPPPVREDALRSSLTLRTTDPCLAPVHHSLSVSRGNSPLLLSHHVSLGLTSVAVDVQFCPADAAAVVVATSTHINSVSTATSATGTLFSSPLGHSQVNDLSAPKMHQDK